MSHDNWSLISNIIRKVLMQLLYKMVSLYKYMICQAYALYLKLGK